MLQNPDSAMHLEQHSAMNPSADFGFRISEGDLRTPRKVICCVDRVL